MVLVKVKGNKPFAPYATLSDSKSLLATWRATAVLGSSMEHGERLANLGWRMWRVRDEMVGPNEDEDAKAPGRKAFDRRAKYTVEALERTKSKSLVLQGPPQYDAATGAILEARTQIRRKARQVWKEKHSAAKGKGKAWRMDSAPSGNAASTSSPSTSQRHQLRVRMNLPRSRSTQGPLWPVVPSTALPEQPYAEPDPLGEPGWTIEAIEAAERELAAQGVDLQGPSLALLGDMKRAELARQCAARNRDAVIARTQAAAAAATAGNDLGMRAGPSQNWPSSVPGLSVAWGGPSTGQDAMRQAPMLQPFSQSPATFEPTPQIPGQQVVPAQANGLHPAVLSFLMQVVSAAQGQGSIESLGALLGQIQGRPPQAGEDSITFQQQQQQHQFGQSQQQHPLSQMMQPGPSSMPGSMLQGSVPGQTPYFSPRGPFSLGLDGTLSSPHSVTGSLSMNQHQVVGGGAPFQSGSHASGLPTPMSLPGSPMGPYDCQTPFNFASPDPHRPRTSTVASAPTPSKPTDESNPPHASSAGEKNSNTAGSSTSDGPKPECHNCGATSTPLWRRDDQFNLQCNACGLYLKLHKVPRPRQLKQRRAERVAKQAAAANGGDVSAASPGASDEWIGRNAGATCANCGTSTTPLWRKDPEGRIICNACGLYYKLRNAHRPVEMRADIIRKRSRYDERRPRDFSTTPAAGATSTSASTSSGGRSSDTTMAAPPHAQHNFSAQDGAGASGLSNEFKPDEQDQTMHMPPPEGSVFLPTELLDSQACPMGAWGEACCQNLPLAPAGSPTLANVAAASQNTPSGVNSAEALRLLIAEGGVGSIANGASLPSDWASGFELDANSNANAQGSNAQLYASPSASTGAGPTPNFSHDAYGHSGVPTPTGIDDALQGVSKRQRTESLSFAATPRPHRATSQVSEASTLAAANNAATASLEADWWASLANTPTAQVPHTNTPEGLALQPPQPTP